MSKNTKITELTPDPMKQQAIEMLIEQQDPAVVEKITMAMKLQQIMDSTTKRSA